MRSHWSRRGPPSREFSTERPRTSQIRTNPTTSCATGRLLSMDLGVTCAGHRWCVPWGRSAPGHAHFLEIFIMSTEDSAVRLQAIEERLARIEKSVFGPELRAHSTPAPRPPVPLQLTPTVELKAAPTLRRAPSAPSALVRPRSAPADNTGVAVSNILGWGGAVALVLAAAYLIRLAVDAGWLTPAVQVGGAAFFGLVLIAVGVGLKGKNRDYAGLLPAAGIAVLFLSVYGAHLLYHLMGAHAAELAVLVVCAVSLGLCTAFDSDLYALFAVAGSYSAPFLIAGAGGSFSDLAIYYSAWSLTFTVFAITRGRRLIYLVALYIALVGFDALARPHNIDWHLLLAFQSAQFLIFGLGAIVFSIRHRSPMDEGVAMLHVPALVVFYGLQYLVLKSNVPGAAPWIAVGTLVAIGLLYLVVRVALGRSSPGGQLLLGSYAALVLFHAGYLESVPSTLAPWVAAAFLAATLLLRGRWSAAERGLQPLLLAVGAMFLLNLLKIFGGNDLNGVPGHQALGFIYAAMLYVGYGLTREDPRQSSISGLLLYAGHLTAMAASLQAIHEPILQSVVWGLLALACMSWSLARHDRLVGQSSLLLFGATGVKVMLSDLDGAAPLARIVSLVILGVTFYVGGMLYQRMTKASDVAAADTGE